MERTVELEKKLEYFEGAREVTSRRVCGVVVEAPVASPSVASPQAGTAAEEDVEEGQRRYVNLSERRGWRSDVVVAVYFPVEAKEETAGKGKGKRREEFEPGGIKRDKRLGC